MPPSPSTAAAAAASPTFLPKLPNVSSLSVITGATRIPTVTPSTRSSSRSRTLKISCQVAVSADVSSSASFSEEELEAASKAGKRIKVKVPIKVYHVNKAPDLDLNGLEGVIKTYVGIWKGKRISANFPFKVEFLLKVEGEEKPVKFFAHMREDEFEYLEDA